MLQLEKDEILTAVIKTEKLSERQAREILSAPGFVESVCLYVLLTFFSHPIVYRIVGSHVADIGV